MNPIDLSVRYNRFYPGDAPLGASYKVLSWMLLKRLCSWSMSTMLLKSQKPRTWSTPGGTRPGGKL